MNANVDVDVDVDVVVEKLELTATESTIFFFFFSNFFSSFGLHFSPTPVIVVNICEGEWKGRGFENVVWRKMQIQMDIEK